MNLIKDWINAILRIAKNNAEYSELHRKVQERIFLFGIEIGLKRKLNTQERAQYRKTLITAQTLFLVAEKEDPKMDGPNPIDHLTAQYLHDWVAEEPSVRASLEKILGHSFSELDHTPAMSPQLRQMTLDQLKLISLLYPDQLPEGEIVSILDRLDHPLDRA
jgi:hypothetical protein